MRLTRIYQNRPLSPGQRHTLDERASGYLTRVLRLKINDALIVFNGAGQEHDARLVKSAQGDWQILVEDAKPICPDSPLCITLVQGISRGERMDYAIQKATELGVAEIQPIACERSVVRLDSDLAKRRLEHWQAVAVSASEQCQRHSVPTVQPILSFADFLNTPSPRARVMLLPTSPSSLKSLTATDHGVELMIGPEGGFSDTEEQLALGRGAQGYRLGPRVLRTETAAAAAISVLQLMKGDLA